MNTDIASYDMIETATETKQLVADSARDFAHQFIKPHVMDWDEAQHFPVDVMKQAGSYGFLGMLVPEEYGGSGFGYHEYVAMIQEISKVDPSIGLSIAAHNSLSTNHILKFGSASQKSSWLPKLASGEWIGAWGLTEHNTGSDAGGMNSTAVQDGDEWILNGTKNFITHGISSDVAVVIFRTGEKGDSHGMTAFVIERGTPGFSSGKKEDKLGMRASETAELIFDQCRIPDGNRLGDVGEGFIQSMKILDGGRISIAALSLGNRKRCLRSGTYNILKNAVQFGKPISSFQGISFKLADMATQIEAAELLTQQASQMINEDKKMTKQSAMCKLYASEACVHIANEAIADFWRIRLFQRISCRKILPRCKALYNWRGHL